MKEKEIRLALDRIESGIAICLDEDERVYHFSADSLTGIREGDLFLALVGSDGTVIVLDRLEDENADRHARNRSRLDRLFGRS